MPKFSNTKEFIEKAIKIHGKKYDYSHVLYKSSREKVDIKCNACQHMFSQRPNDHLMGKGCIKCSGRYLYSNYEFITKANKVHKNEYNYSKVNYIHSHHKVKIICHKHGTFIQSPYHHLRGSKCPTCLHKISRLERDFLLWMGIKTTNYSLPKWKKKKVDGYDRENNTVYEFLGDYWHGNPEIYKQTDLNPDTKLKYGILLKKTYEKLTKMKSLGYKVKYIWENDWRKFKRGVHTIPLIYQVL